MPTRVMAIADQLIDEVKAGDLNATSGLDLTAAQWQAAFGATMADGDLQAALTAAKNRESAHRSVIGALQNLSNSAGAAGEPDYMAAALTEALTTLTAALQRPYNPATDAIVSDEVSEI